MAKRVSKKLLLGLGSTLAFGSVGVITGFGLKSIIDYNNQQNFLNQINGLSEANFDTAPDYNKATADMFFDTTDLKSFHFGDVQKGQTITPYGWLGVFEPSVTISRKIALTGWNGEILWVNDDYKDQGNETKFNVYDMKYDFNTDLIFVVRSNSDNGLYLSNTTTLADVSLDILDAKTGVKKDSIDEATFKNIQASAQGFMNGKFLNWSDENHRARSKNLFSIDVISKPRTNDVVISWTPNFLQLTLRQNSPGGVWDNAINRITPFADIVDGYSKMVSTIVITKNGSNVSHSGVKRMDIRKSGQVQNSPGQPAWWPIDYDYIHNYSLIANPFITMNGNNFIVHILTSNKDGSKIVHKTVEYDSNGNYLKNNKDTTENITGNFPILNDATWIKNSDWSNDFVNANLKINRNMFDSNSVVFAYPYASGGSSGRLPIFNVAQLLINPADGKIIWNNGTPKNSKILPFAREIIEYWQNNNGSYNTNANLNKIYPFTGGGQTNLNHNYNRLISVSPFDNTVLYASKPNLLNATFDQTDNKADKWANFWIGNFGRKTPYRPFIIYNDSTTGGTVNAKMTSISELYNKGLTFDLRSLTGQSLNLYFNQTGSGRNDKYSANGFRTSKIGLLTDVLSRDNQGNIWFGNVTSPTNQPLDKMGTEINESSYSTLIYSRADLEKWYPRTWQNIEFPGNVLTPIKINGDASEDKRAVAKSFGSILEEGDLFNSNRSVDLLSDWYDKGNKTPVNYGRLLVKRPEIKVRNLSIANKLPIETIYPFSNSDFLNQNIWIKTLSNDEKSGLVFKTTQDLSSASYQIFSSWKEQVRMERIGLDTNNLNAVENPNVKGGPSWYDRRQQNANANPFGKINNNLDINGKKPLRMLLQIAKPSTGTIPQWFTLIDKRFFDKYPLRKDAVSGETSFEEILQKFLEEKTRKINLSQESSSPVGLGNLKIDAFLDVNPSIVSQTNDFTIYKKGTKKRLVVQNSTGLRIIYEDNYSQQWHEIYDQSQTIYQQFNRGGFGDAVRANVQTSWMQGRMPAATTKLKTIINAQNFQDNLVRKSSTDRKIFTFDYDATDSSKLIITATDKSWLRPRLLNFQRLINMTPIFEFKTHDNSNWRVLTTQSDADMARLWPDGNSNTFKLPTSGINNISKLRLRLKPTYISKPDDPNSFVQFESYSDTENKFISDEQDVGIQRIDVNKDWFNQISLENNSNSLANLSALDFQKFEDDIFKKSAAIGRDQTLREKVKLMYKWNGEPTKLDKDGISRLIQERLADFNSNDQGVFALWNGVTGIKIEVFFEKVDQTVSFVVNGNNLNPTENDLKGFVKTQNINNLINLGPYINELTSKIINATAGSTVGQFSGTTIQFPPKSGTPGNEQFAGKTYNEIEEILKNVGVLIQYKKWQPNDTWSGWLTNLSDIDAYNPSNPQIKIGFKTNGFNQNWNIKLYNNGTEITGNDDFTLNLNLPKLVKLPADDKVAKLIQDFNNQNIFSGNTFKLDVNDNKLQSGKKIVSDALKAASSSNGSGYDGLEKYLELKFQLGNTGQWFDAKGLQGFLLTQNNIDQENSSLKMKVELTQNSEFIFENALSSKEFDLLSDNNPTIKKYIHGNTLEQELNQITASGTTTLIAYTYPNEIKKVVENKKAGLKLQYTYNSTLAPNARSSFKDASTNWTDAVNGLPTTGIPTGTKAIYVRIVVSDPNTYVYGPDFNNNKTKGTIDLANLKDQINVQSSWLNKKFPEDNLINFEQISLEKIEQFETNVINQIPTLTDEQKEKLEIRYYFNGAANPVNKTELFNQLTKYQNSDKFNFLQLWNGTQGEKIEATFVKKDQTGNYDLIWDPNDSGKQILDTSKVVTTINLISLVQWLEQIKVTVNKNGNLIDSLVFPNINASEPFNGKTWSKTESALELLAIRVEYQELTSGTNSNIWHDDINMIKNYDSRAQFKIRFVLQKEKGKNLIVKVRENNQLTGTSNSDVISSDIFVNLNVPKVIKIDPNAVENFRRSNPFSGNTKRIKVDETKLSTLISDIKKSSLNSGIPLIVNAPLDLEFRFGNSGNFKLLEQWQNDSEAMGTDQTTNLIQIKFIIPDQSSNEWAVENPDGIYTVLNANDPSVPIYVHDQGIEESIQTRTNITGDNTNLQINFPTGDGFTVDTNNRISGSKGNGLKIQFSLDESLNVNATNGWSDQRPNSVPIGTDKIFMRIVPVDNWHVYEKMVDGPYDKIEVNFKIAQRLIVNKQWINEFQLGGPSIEIADLTVEKINEWIGKIQEKVKTTNNNISDVIAKKVSIKFNYKNQQNLTAEKLYEAIKTDREAFSSPNLGIVQLWNGIKGDKINATFVSLSNDVIIEDANGNQQISDDINTKNIYTKINLENYINVLKTNKTTVQRGSASGQMNSFTPPPMNGTTGQFAGKSYDEISKRLKDVGIEIQFSSELNNPQWLDKEAIKTYNPQTAVLYLAFTNPQDNNIKLSVDNGNPIEAGNSNKTNPIKLLLNIPKQINIKQNDLNNFQTEINFSRDTKRIEFNANASQSLITKILQRNSNEANGDPTFNSAPLIIEFKIGDTDWKKPNELKGYLSSISDDLKSRSIKYHFKLENNANSDWELEAGADQERELFSDNTSPLKIYVNDNGILNDLRDTTFSGTNQALSWHWKSGISVNPKDGQLRKNVNNKVSGVGLKLAYSFDQKDWTNEQPNSYSQDVNRVYLKIQLEDPDKYVYDKLTEVIELELNLPVNVTLKKSWLNQQFIPNVQSLDDFIKNIKTILDEYEKKVISAAQQDGISDEIKTKFKIQYTFNENDNSPLDQDQLIQKIQSYQTDNANNNTFGILQLWNQTSGVKIKALFSDANKNDNFNITVDPDEQPFLLDTSNVQTTINFSGVLNWLTDQNMKVPIEEGDAANSIDEIKIPRTSGLTSDPFNDREWVQIEKALSDFGITINYKADGVQTATWGPLISIKVYDPASGQIEFKFKFDQTKSKNIKLQLNSTTHDGATENESQVYKFKLKVKLSLIVDQVKINQFLQNANIKGDTKFIQINQQAEQTLIDTIKKANAANNPEFNSAILKVQYYLGSEKDQKIEWKEWDQFKNDLEQQTIDQKTNRVVFRLSIDESQDEKFSVANTTYVLHDNNQDAGAWTVKYFINKANLENSARSISVRGTSSNIIWNYDSFGTSRVEKAPQQNGNNKIYIKNIYGQRMLQVFFSTNENINYGDNESDNLDEISSKWVSLEPSQFLDAWNVSKLFVKLVPMTGYIYEAQKDGSANKHQISLENLKLEIKVNPNHLNTTLNLTAEKKYLHELTVDNINEFVTRAINTVNLNRDKVDVEFKFRNKNLNATQLFKEIQTALKMNGTTPKNIVQLWNGTSGEKIEARFILKESAREQYILIDSENEKNDAERFVPIVTNDIKTLIDLKVIVKELTKLKINVVLSNQVLYDLTPLNKLEMPQIPTGELSELQGLTWENFEKRLAGFGVLIQARPKVKGTNTEAWTSIAGVKKYDSNLLALELRFKVNAPNGQNIVLSVEQNEDVNIGTSEADLPIFEMNLKAPAKVEVNNTLLENFVKQEIFRGNTKYLEIVSEQPEADLIQAIIDQNIANNADIFKELQGRLEVQYYLGKNDPTNQPNNNWYSAQGLKTFLETQTRDQNTNKIWFRLNIKESDNPNAQIFQVDQSARVLNNEQIDAAAKIKIYINETGFSAQISKLKAVGSTDKFEIRGLTEWEATVPNGLEIGYSKELDPDEADINSWTQNLPNTLTSDKKLWVRFKVEDGYVYQNAINNSNYGQKHQINTDGIKVIIKLKSEWLEKILITGSTRNAVIDETNVLDAITNEGILPIDQPDLIELQYSIKATDKWLNKNDFQNKLIELNGAKDSKNFILRRDDLQVRFNIKANNRNDNYGLNIDNQIVDDTNRNNFNKDIVATGRNDSFKGVINLDHLKYFSLENFKVIGSTTEPKLIIPKRKELNELFMPYASDDLFDIQFSTVKKPNDEWEWNNNQSILEKTQLISEDGLIKQGITIGADKHFAIRFIAKDSNYDVFAQNQDQPNGYILDISDNVKITVEIINPFTANNKTLGLWTRENTNGNNVAKYYQGQGGFKIAVANKDTFIVENNGQQSAQQFLNTTSSLTDVERNALELVYHVFGPNPSGSEIERVEKSITDYEDQETWKPFDSIKENGSDWSRSLDLKVGDNVAVALRVKETFANQENPFILKGYDHSMILPIMKDVTGKMQKPARLSGYKVNTDLIDIQKDNVILSNMFSSQLPPLDGWTELQRVNLQADQLDNYLGVDLKMQVYTEFHEKPAGQILFSGSNTKLVKRLTDKDDNDVIDKGNYKDKNNQNITDKDGEEVKIYKKNNRLSPPKKNPNVTKDRMLVNLGGGSFRFEPDTNSYERGRLSLFRNQDVDLSLVANKGEGTVDLPDFYLDKEKVIPLKESISNQIKFPIENEKKISYAWNYEDFLPGQIKYKSPGSNNPNPEDGNAQIDTIYKLIKKIGNSEPIEITGTSINEAFQKIEQQLNEDFEGQLRFETIHQTSNGSQVILKNSNIYQFTNLKNKDRIILRIVAVEDDLFYVTEDAPLVINVNGLTEAAPDQNKLQYLRVKQGGVINGQGSFKVLVSNPEKDDEDDQSILKGWKFLIRVWTKDENGVPQIKIPWSDDPAQIKGLSNGDRVEWKLVSSDGNPVKDAYYNTIALDHKQKPDGNVDYQFGQVNYPKGQGSYDIIHKGIGAYPEDDNQYPENSGFVISNLKPTFEVFKIDQSTFEAIIKQLNPFYVGLNKQGTINFDKKYFENDYWVNTKGEIYLKDGNQSKLNNEIEELVEIPIKEFLNNITFFTQDPVLYPYQNGFKFSANDVNINNHLANGDHVWAQFDMVSFKDENDDNSRINSGTNISSITWQLADVSGLKNIIDPMSPFWYVLIALAGIATLGTASLIAFLVARHKKLKGKN